MHMAWNRIALAMVALIMGAAATGELMAEPVTLHVATNGKDTWSGRLAAPNAAGDDGPLASIAGARDAIRGLRRSQQRSGAVWPPVTVAVQGGSYRIAQPIVFEEQDFGPADSNVTYAAAEAARPVISGGRVITGFKKGSGEVWTVELPEVKAGKWAFRQLFVNGRRAVRARTPNEGFLTVNGNIEGVAAFSTAPTTAPVQSSFKFRGQDIKPEWAGQAVEVVALQAWAEMRVRIARVAPDTSTATLEGAAAPSNREANARYWLENAAEFLDAPGEWFLDTAAGVLSYWPRAGEDMAKAEVVAPVTAELVRFAGDGATGKCVQGVVFRGLDFRHADWTLGQRGYTDVQAAHDIPAAISARGADGCGLEDCRVGQVGGWAVQWGEGCKNCFLRGCELTDLGAGGVKIGTPGQFQDQARQNCGNVVSRCRIHDIGIVYPAAVGVWIGQSYDNRVDRCEIFDTYYSAVSVGWTWGYGPTQARGNVVEFNHLHDIGRGMLSDMGGVYTLGVQPGTVIRNNVIHDVRSHGYGGWGLYTDEGSTGIVLENNIVYRTKSGSFHQHYGRDNIVRNNILALSSEGQIIRSRQEEHNSFTFEHNIVYFEGGTLLGGAWDNDKFVMDSNLYWNARGQEVRFGKLSLEDWRKRGHDEHSIIADPKFVNVQKGDFSMAADSPAGKAGFKPIDVSAVGPGPGK